MYMDQYFTEMKKVLTKIEDTQKENILKAADTIVNSLVKDGMWHIIDTGHMLMHECIGRTGGMMALRPIKVDCEVNNPTRFRSRQGKQKVTYDTVEGFPQFVLGQANIREGDVLIIGSVSGYNKMPVELALEARRMGIKTIALTSVQYSERLTSKHPSKLRLFEATDIVLDNCSNFSDTLVDVPELNKRICPSSGIGAAYIMWALQSAVVEKLIEKGLNPSVYISNHMPNAGILNDESWKNYEKNGY
ncbi:MAG: sugar isomerase domain-containing protein [Bacilli bacterium]|nr:sugar isomerase domain-containing protein [Bacilli bacterium]